MARYGQAVQRSDCGEAVAAGEFGIDLVSREVGISVATLERWRADALANGSATGRPRWTAAARWQAVIVTAAMDEATRAPGVASKGCIRRSWMPGSGMRSPVSASRGRPVPWKLGRTAGGSRNWSGSFIARTRHWPKRPPCSCYQKNSRRSSAKARTHDPPGRPPDPGA